MQDKKVMIVRNIQNKNLFMKKYKKRRKKKLQS